MIENFFCLRKKPRTSADVLMLQQKAKERSSPRFYVAPQLHHILSLTAAINKSLDQLGWH